MKNAPKTNFGHEIADTDDISIGISDDGERYVIQHDPSGETVELGAGGAEVGALQSQELSVNQFARYADFVVTTDDLTDRIYDKHNDAIYEGENLGAMLQTVIDNWGNIPLHIHFTNSNGNQRNHFQIEQTVTWKASSLCITGAGKNKTMIEAGDGLNSDMFVFDVGSTGTNAIYEIVGLKCIGNKDSNISGNGLVFKQSNEINLYRMEVRSFVGDNIRIAPTTSYNWNKMVDVWTLDADGACMSYYRGDGGAGGLITEMDMIGCTISNQSSATGSKGLYIDDNGGNSIDNLNMVGGRFKGDDPAEIRAGNQISFHGVHWHNVGGDYGLKLGGGTNNRLLDLSIKNCQMYGNPTHWIVPGKDDLGAVDVKEKFSVSNNRFTGHQTGIIQNAEDNFIGWDIQNNTPPIEMDVTLTRRPSDVDRAWHDGTGTDNPRGPTYYDDPSSSWISLVDGTTIS